MTTFLRSLLIAATLAVLLNRPTSAAEPAVTGGVTGPARVAEPPAVPLPDLQKGIETRFKRFEDTLMKMARYLQKTEPARAELVLRALNRSKEEQVAKRMELIARLLDGRDGTATQYADAINEQTAILVSLKELLTILRSEDILDENRREQERLKELAKQISALIDSEKVQQAATTRGEATEKVAKNQQGTADKTAKVIADIDQHDGKPAGDKDKAGEKPPGDPKTGDPKDGDEKPGETKPGESKPGEAKPGEAKPEESKPGEAKPGEAKPGESKPGESKPGESKPGESKPGESKPGESKPGESKPEESQPGKQTPGREELEAAKQRMEQAIKDLQEKNRENASKEQEEAIQKLIEAKEKIEELLRQLREEERELVLRALEARFQKMLQLQQTVLEVTQDLNRKPFDAWADRDFAKARDAAATEREIGIEADKALEVLRADGSSVAFPEAVEQLIGDVGNVAGRLGRDDVGDLTIVIENDIIDALKEMIDAFQKEMEKLKEQKAQPGQQGQPDDPSLVDKLAELKMLRTLQLRVNRRTRTLGELFPGETATDTDLIEQLRELADRQGRIQRATYDMATGKTAN